MAYLTLLSTEAEGHASQAAIRSFQRLAAHMRQAVSLGQVVEQRAATQAALLDALARRADGVILLDRSGAPSFLNDTARAVLAAGDGLAFAGGAFVTRRGPETRRLQQLIGDAIALVPPSESRPGGEMLVTRADGRRPYVVRVMPAPKTERFLSGLCVACVIHLHDLAAVRVPSASLLCAAFGLTEREAELAIELVRCAGLAGAAENAGMALNTARNHMQAIFARAAPPARPRRSSFSRGWPDRRGPHRTDLVLAASHVSCHDTPVVMARECGPPSWVLHTAWRFAIHLRSRAPLDDHLGGPQSRAMTPVGLHRPEGLPSPFALANPSRRPACRTGRMTRSPRHRPMPATALRRHRMKPNLVRAALLCLAVLLRPRRRWRPTIPSPASISSSRNIPAAPTA